MARRGKTVIGERNLAQTGAMMRAGEEGVKAEQRATEGVARQSDRGLQYGLQVGGQAAQAFEQGQGRQLQEEIATGREIQEEKGRKANLAAQGLEETPGGPESPRIGRHREGLEGDVQRGKDAEKSLQPGGEPQAAQEQPSTGPAGPGEGGIPQPARLDQLAQQAETPVETVRPGKVRPGSIVESARGQEMARGRQVGQEIASYKAITERMRISESIAKARATGNEAEVASLKKNLENKMKPEIKLLDRLMNSKPLPGDLNTVEKWMENMGGADPQLQADLDTARSTSMATPRLRDFISNRIASTALDFVEGTGGDRPSVGMDPTSPAIQLFERNNQVISQVMASVPGMGSAYEGINTQGDKIRFVQEMSAWFTKQMLANPAKAKATMQQLMASQAPDPQQQAQMEAKGQGEQDRERGTPPQPSVSGPGPGAFSGSSAGSPAKWSNVR